MNDLVQPLPGCLVTPVSAVDREFETRLGESSTLAFRVAFGVLRHREDAEDVAQEAFARAYRRFHQLRDRDAFRAWLVRMTWRLALDRRRGERRRTLREQAVVVDPVVPSAEREVVEADRARRLWNAIDRLPEPLRLTIVLASMHEHAMKEVATLTGVAEGTVKSRVFDAKQRLKELLS
jgi:RNA polymerase sigma-70 factor (ECF subfamily)